MKAEITKIVLKLKGREIELSAEEAKAAMEELQRLFEIKEVPVYYPVPNYPPVITQPSIVNPPWQPPIVWCGGLSSTTEIGGGMYQLTS